MIFNVLNLLHTAPAPHIKTVVGRAGPGWVGVAGRVVQGRVGGARGGGGRGWWADLGLLVGMLVHLKRANVCAE